MRNAAAVTDIFRRIELAARFAVIAVNGAVKLKNTFAAGLLVQAVDILRYDGTELAGLLQLWAAFGG